MDESAVLLGGVGGRLDRTEAALTTDRLARFELRALLLDEAATVNGVSVELYLTPEAKVRLQVEMLDGFEYTLMTDVDLRAVKEMLPAADLFPLPLWDAVVTLAWEEAPAPIVLPGHRSRQSALAQ